MGRGRRGEKRKRGEVKGKCEEGDEKSEESGEMTRRKGEEGRGGKK